MAVSVVKRSIYYPLLTTFMLAIGGVFLWVIGVHYELESDQNLFVLLLAVQLIPLFVCLARRAPDYLVFIFGSYALTYTATRIMEYSTAGSMTSEARNELVQMIVCNLITLIAYYSWRYFTIEEKHLRETLKVIDCTPNMLFFLMGAFLVSQFLQRAIPSFARMGDAFSTSFAVFIMCATCRESKFLSLLSKGLILVTALVMVIGAGMLGRAINLVFMLLPLLFVARRWKLIFLMIPIILGGLVFHTIKGAYRSFVWTEEEVPFEQRVILIKELVQALFIPDAQVRSEVSTAIELVNETIAAKRALESPDGLEAFQEMDLPVASLTDMITLSAGRVADASLERVLSMTPSEVPFWNGETYLNALYTFVPRVIWPNKPQWDLGPRFGHAYGYLDELDESTSISYSYLAEGYMNFGYIGLYSVAILMGLLIAALESGTLMIQKPGCNLPAYILFLPSLAIYQIELVTAFQTVVVDAVVFFVVVYFVIPKSPREVPL